MFFSMRNTNIILLLFAFLFLPTLQYAQVVTLKTDTISVPCTSTDTFLVPVKVLNFNNLGGLQFTIEWDTTLSKFIHIQDFNPLLGNGFVNMDSTTHFTKGQITFAWLDPSGLSIPNSGNNTLFKMAFVRLGGAFSAVAFDTTALPFPPPTAITVSDPNFNPLPFNLSIGGVKTTDLVPPTISCPAPVQLMSNSPIAVSNIAPTAINDNCGINFTGWKSAGATNANFPNDPNASGAVFNPGISTVTYSTTDFGGNTATCSFAINIIFDPNASDTLTFTASSGASNCGAVFFTDVTTNNFDSIFGAQFSLQWLTSVLKFDSLGLFNTNLNVTAGNFNTNFAQSGGPVAGSGNLSFGWNSDDFTNGSSVPDGARLFRIYFTVQSPHGSSSSINFVNFPAAQLSINAALNPVATSYVSGQFNVNDITPPTIQCPPNQVVTAVVGMSSATVTGLEPIVLTDNCSGNIALNYTPAGLGSGFGVGPANGTYPGGTNTVTYRATDLAGNTSTCSFLVTVDLGSVFELKIDSVQYNCNSTSTVSIPFRVKKFSDIAGMNFRVEWDPAVLSYTGFGNVFAGMGINGANFPSAATTGPLGYVNFLAVSPTGIWPNIPDGGIVFALNFTVLNPNATTNIEFIQPLNAINGSFAATPFNFINGNFKSVDLTPPTITCPPNQLASGSANCSALVVLPSATATDNCGTVSSIVNNAPPTSVYPAGLTIVVFTANDNSNNSSTCSMTVTVNANTALQIANCPTAPITINAIQNCSAALAYPAILASNPCVANANFTYNCNFPVGTIRPVGTTNVVCTATQLGNGGGFVTCNFQVKIVDAAAPVLTCPASLTLEAAGTDCFVTNPSLNLPTVTDNCDQGLIATIDSDLTDTIFTGVNTLIYLATDDAGNVGTCSFLVTVKDVNPPSIACPPSITVSATTNCMGAATWSAPVVSDNCTNTSNINVSGTATSGNTFAIGTNLVTYTATDASQNTASCTFDIKVVEDVPPSITCPNSVFLLLPTNKCDTILNWTEPTATDNCGIDTVMTNFAPGSVFPSGTTTVVYTATDFAGNTATCSFTVAALDKVAPVFTSFPNDIVITNADPCGHILNLPDPSGTDNCDPNPMVSPTGVLQDTFPIGTTKIEFLITDASGNITKDTLSITISSMNIPQFGNFPDNQNITGCSGVANWTEPTVQGFCTTPVVTSSHDSGDIFPVGTTVVTYTANEVNGITIARTFTITISDPSPPTINCPQPVVVNAAGVVISDPSNAVATITGSASCQSADLTFNPLTVTDDCDPTPTLVQVSGPTANGNYPIGNYTLTYQATDEFGNSSTCAFTVNVTPFLITAPTVEPNPGCEGEMVVLSVTAYPNATYAWTGPQTSYPNTASITIFSLAQGNTGNYSVTASLNGCTATAAPVTVVMAVKPIAEDDLGFTIGLGDTLTAASVLLNDNFTALTDISFAQQSPLDGLSFNTSDGTFKYVSGAAGTFSYIYEICSIACPDLCDMATVTINVRDNKCDFIPNIFTPNNDQTNDVFEIPCLDSGLYPNNTLVVYSQWGDKVFEAKGYENTLGKAWDGTFNNEAGRELPDGVYYYIFKQDSSAAALKGFVHIYR
jgi:gliding motility-associated-like protein